MKAITIQQPWAWAVAEGAKTVENRTQLGTWRPAIDAGRIAVHAGGRWSQRGAESPLIIDAMRRWVAPSQQGRPIDRAEHTQLFPMGAFIATVSVVNVHHLGYWCAPEVCLPWGEESYVQADGKKRVDVVHLVLRDARRLPVPIQWPGRLGLWSVPEHLQDELGAA